MKKVFFRHKGWLEPWQRCHQFRSACSARSVGSHCVVPHWGPPISTGEVPQGVPSSPWPHPGTIPTATSHRALQEPGRFGAFLFFSSLSGFYKDRRKTTPSARPGWKFIPGHIHLLLALVWWEALRLPWVPGAGSPKGEGTLASPCSALGPLLGTCHHCSPPW